MVRSGGGGRARANKRAAAAAPVSIGPPIDLSNGFRTLSDRLTVPNEPLCAAAVAAAAENATHSSPANRFLAICFPMDWHMSRRTARWVIAGIWLFGALVSAPWAIFFTLLPADTFDESANASLAAAAAKVAGDLGASATATAAAATGNSSGPLPRAGGGAPTTLATTPTTTPPTTASGRAPLTVAVCAEEWPSEEMGKWYFVFANLILCYLFPATVIILCYLGIWHKIERRNIPGENPKGLKIELIMQRSKLKVVKMMMVVVVIFLLSWLPLYLIWARIKLAQERSQLEEWLIQLTMPLAQW